MTVDAAAHVVVIGGGIAGLAAAFFLKDEPVRVTVLEGSPRLGGKLSMADVAGVTMDEGAEALLAMRPEGIDMIASAGLSDDLVPSRCHLVRHLHQWVLMRSLPRRQFMGVPADLDELAATGVISADGIARARQESSRPGQNRRHVGHGVHRLAPRCRDRDRLVDPLLGGVYAGRSEDLSFQATLALSPAARAGTPR